MKGRIAAKADEALQRASEIIQSATQEANSLKQRIISETENDAVKAKRSPQGCGVAGQQPHRRSPEEG